LTVVGADGRHLSVAQNGRAEEYLANEASRAMYCAYWNAPDIWRTDSRDQVNDLPFLLFARRDERLLLKGTGAFFLDKLIPAASTLKAE
jgi:hypothetical protein